MLNKKATLTFELGVFLEVKTPYSSLCWFASVIASAVLMQKVNFGELFCFHHDLFN